MMEEAEESRNDFMQRLKSCSGTSPSTGSESSSIPRANRIDLLNFNGPQVRGQFRHFPPSPDAAKRNGIPPAHPHFSPSSYQLISTTVAAGAARSPSSSHLFAPVPTHSRSLSQPAFFNLDSLPQFTSPSPPFAAASPAPSDPSSSADVEMDDRGVTVASSHCSPPPVPLVRTNSGGGSGRATGDGLPPRKAHRRSQSDIPFGFLQSSAAALPPLPHQTPGFPSPLISPRTSNQFVKQETEWDREGDGSIERKSDGDAGDDLFSAYMNLESFDTLNSSGNEEKREDSRASGTRTNGADSSENEAESSVNESGSSLQLRGMSSERKEGNKRSAAGDPAPINLSASRHNRSISMDSFMGKLQFGEESLNLPPSPGPQVGQHSRSGSLDGTANTFSLEFGNGEFSGAELKKIMANEKLAEIAMADPKRAKRILANRQSAARSKERKMRYISELEHKVQTLQTEATTLSAQLTLLQRDSAGLTNQNNEMKFRLQAMEQQAKLRDALNEALTSEVQRLKLATGEAQLANSLNQQMQLNPQMFPLQQQLQKQQQQSSQFSHYQMQPQHQPQQQQQQKNNVVSKHDANKHDSNK